MKKSTSSDKNEFMFTNLIVNGKNYGKVNTSIRSIGLCLGLYVTDNSASTYSCDQIVGAYVDFC